MGKDIIKSIRFSEDEVNHLEKRAKQEKRKFSDFLRCELLKDKGEGWKK
jgi:hypothetical protein